MHIKIEMRNMVYFTSVEELIPCQIVACGYQAKVSKSDTSIEKPCDEDQESLAKVRYPESKNATKKELFKMVECQEYRLLYR